MATVGFLHPGAMGAALAAAVRTQGHEALWASEGRSAASAERAHAAGIADAGTVAALTAACDVVISICPPDAAVDLAASLPPFDGLFVDANATAPATAETVAGIVTAAGAEYVDGGVIGMPPPSPRGTRLYLSGAAAETVAALFAGSAFDALVLTEGPFAASALKMVYAAYSKQSLALLLATTEAAAALGVDAALEAEWGAHQPALLDRVGVAARNRAEKGWRWTGEMREVAATFAAVGVPTGFAEAAEAVFAPRSPVGDA